ncbi:hypothetical protein AB0J55_17555 [Amycolatopsis sp. NPDC049688]|uniref:hypothetical protein n=1 Tax=Amycolatopsis sp. NPDC049688 TaxID=3154733 RepID=UPI0034383046
MTLANDPVVAHIRQLHERFEQEREAIRTRSIALGYAFGRVDERVASGGDPPDDDRHASAFADTYENYSDGSWADLATQYAAFLTGKDTPK